MRLPAPAPSRDTHTSFLTNTMNRQPAMSQPRPKTPTEMQGRPTAAKKPKGLRATDGRPVESYSQPSSIGRHAEELVHITLA